MPRRNATNPLGQGPSGYCVCPNCGVRISHTANVPGVSLKCPNCGSPMIRGS